MLITLVDQLLNLISTILNLYVWVIIAQSLISWVRPDPYSPVVQFLYKMVYPAYYLVSKLPFSTVIGSIDLAPILIIIILQVLSVFISTYLKVFLIGLLL